MYRWTIKELEEINDKTFIDSVLNDKQNGLTNCYSPLSNKINAAKKCLNELVNANKKGEELLEKIAKIYLDWYNSDLEDNTARKPLFEIGEELKKEGFI